LSGVDPIGQMFQTGQEPGYPAASYEIVGVVADTKYSRLREDIRPIAFVPAAQHPSPQAGAAMVRSNELRARVDAIFQEVRMSRSRFVAVSAVMAAVVGTAAGIASTQAPLYATAVQSAHSSVARDQVGPVAELVGGSHHRRP